MKLTPFVRIYGENGDELRDGITRFTYRYSEENDDECHLQFQTLDVKIADKPPYQEGKKLTVEWGFLNNPETAQRTIYIFDTVTAYTDNGVNLELICHEKFTMSKINKAGTSKGNNKTSKKDSQVLVLGFDVLSRLQVAIEDGNQELVNLLKSAGIEIQSDSLRLTESGWVDSNTADVVGYKANQNVGLEYKKGTQVNQKEVAISPGMDMVYYNASVASFRTLRKYLDKLPGGPYVIDSRDDAVTIKTRDFGKDPVRAYHYKDEDGELLDFTPETKNRQHAKGSSRTSVTGWDSKTKKVTNSTSSKNTGTVLADGSTENTLIESLWSKYPLARPYNPFPAGENIPDRQFNLKEPKKNQPTGATTFGVNLWEQQLEEDRRNRQRREQTEPGVKTIKDLGGTGPNNYNPDEVKESTQSLEPWETPGRVPARQNKKNGGITGGRDNTYVYQEKTMPQWRVTPAGTPEKNRVVGDEGSNAHNKIKSSAKNEREDNQLKNNPASARMIGNPLLKTGSIITILNVAEKHAGNYYIQEVEHQIGEDGYITMINTMVRQGSNKTNKKVKTKEASISSEKVSINNTAQPEKVDKKTEEPVVNNKVGPSKNEPIKVTTISNQDKVRVENNRPSGENIRTRRADET